ncbi:MAG TPA: RNA pyrophosphohydrolase [Hyphomonadaceae bacterium]|nr:RNA pyrophosphohydrolase [Hyphomonadaceae bacterium]
MSYSAFPEQGGRDPSLYRPNVGLAIFSRKGHLWLGRRAGVRKDDARYAWQMPQGGIDRGETPAIAALRELGEETGINTSHVELLEELEPWLYYDFPPALKAKLTGPYYGQRQKWFAYRFTGSDTDFRLDDHTPEFDAWKWAKLEDAAGLVIPFKAAVYAEVATRFAKWTEA